MTNAREEMRALSPTYAHLCARVSLVEMTHLGPQPESAQQPPAADAEHQLLFDSVLVVSGIQLTRDPAVGGEIGGVVAVEKK